MNRTERRVGGEGRGAAGEKDETGEADSLGVGREKGESTEKKHMVSGGV